MKAVITVTGKDTVGIIALVSQECSRYGVNIVDISQSVMREYFAMIMLVELEGLSVAFADFAKELEKFQLFIEAHGNNQGLVPVAQVDAAPNRGRVQRRFFRPVHRNARGLEILLCVFLTVFHIVFVPRVWGFHCGLFRVATKKKSLLRAENA